MTVLALLVAIVAVLAGVAALGDVVAGEGPSRLKQLAAAHVAIASLGVILLLVAIVSVGQGPTWASLTCLVIAASLGLTLMTFTRRGREVTEIYEEGGDEVAVPGRVPVPVVVIHGVAALLTVALVLAAALGSRRGGH